MLSDYIAGEQVQKEAFCMVGGTASKSGKETELWRTTNECSVNKLLYWAKESSQIVIRV